MLFAPWDHHRRLWSFACVPRGLWGWFLKGFCFPWGGILKVFLGPTGVWKDSVKDPHGFWRDPDGAKFRLKSKKTVIRGGFGR